MNNNVLIIGTGTIGEPLIGLLANFKKKLKINVYFHKRTPLIDEVAKVNSLIDRGANLVVDEDQVKAFQELGHEPVLVYEAALTLCDVVIDCTPAGNLAKKKHYLPLASKKGKRKVFIAQGSEKGFGIPYAYGINDSVLSSNLDFIQVVSCNTHNISSIIKTLAPNINNLVYGDFTCIRRANDISQEDSFIASPQVGKHPDIRFGTHHARDTYDLFRTVHECPNIFSSALKINTQYMHIIRFNLQLKGHAAKDTIIDRLKENKFTALTYKTLTNKVFSFGRDHGYYGRIYNHTVVSIPSIYVGQLSGETLVSGYCFTPQDGNSLLSSVAAGMYAVHGKKYKDYMSHFDDLLFEEI